MKTVVLRNRLDRHAEGQNVVGCGQRLLVLEVDLVLSFRDLVVARLDLEAHLLKHQADLAAHVAAVVDRRHIEVARSVRRARRRQALFVGFEEEKLHLRTDVECVPQFLRAAKRPFQNVARIADKRRAVGIVDVTDQPRRLVHGGLPRQDREGVEIGTQILIGFVDARKALDRAAVDHDPVVQDLVDLRARNRDVLHLSENVGKLQADEFDVFFIDDTDDVLFCIMLHGFSPLFL